MAVVGFPQPTITWFINDRSLDKNDLKLTNEEAANRTYSCVASNKLGKAETHCFVTTSTKDDTACGSKLMKNLLKKLLDLINANISNNFDFCKLSNLGHVSVILSAAAYMTSLKLYL